MNFHSSEKSHLVKENKGKRSASFMLHHYSSSNNVKQYNKIFALKIDGKNKKIIIKQHSGKES